jgi:hypothetical protein
MISRVRAKATQPFVYTEPALAPTPGLRRPREVQATRFFLQERSHIVKATGRCILYLRFGFPSILNWQTTESFTNSFLISSKEIKPCSISPCFTSSKEIPRSPVYLPPRSSSDVIATFFHSEFPEFCSVIEMANLSVTLTWWYSITFKPEGF